MFRVNATALQNPKIMYGNDVSLYMPPNARWAVDKKKFYSTRSTSFPYLIFREGAVKEENCKHLRTKFEEQIKSRGVGQAKFLGEKTIKFDEETGSHEAKLRKKFQDSIVEHENVKLVVLMLSNSDQDIYSSFKYLADRVFGFNTVVFVEKSNVRGRDWNAGGVDQYVGNVVMKANLKFHGINHIADSSNNVSKKWLKDTLVLGADVTHPSGGALPGCPSIAAIVGSTEETGGRFLGSIQLQSEGDKEVSYTFSLLSAITNKHRSSMPTHWY
jgi:eukaryotic translation initiation factor 2C